MGCVLLGGELGSKENPV